jgi:hypothetical protein
MREGGLLWHHRCIDLKQIVYSKEVLHTKIPLDYHRIYYLKRTQKSRATISEEQDPKPGTRYYGLQVK